MDRNFYMERETNFFDNMVVNIGELYERFPLQKDQDAKSCFVPSMQGRFHKIYRNRLIPLRRREQIWHLLRRTNLDLSWFGEFSSYWSSVLKGRPLYTVHDFYFLRNLYRIRFQNNQVPDDSTSQAHVEAWQRPELLYFLFHQVLRESIFNQLPALEVMQRHIKQPAAILEFGCGTAPITTSMHEFFLPTNQQMLIADIQTLAFHYAVHRFRKCLNVIPLLLSPENDFLPAQEKETIDVIFCITVFEHLPEPLQAVQTFYRLLRQGGLLIFDYARSAGCGMDTRQGMEQRKDVLDFISSRFDIVEGKLNQEHTVLLTAARKR